jgi:hypothetical protein
MLSAVSTTVMHSAAPRRSLAPREHGAYAELGLPLATALLMGRPGLAPVLLAVAAVAMFAAHESLLVVLGHRGARARREDGHRAVRVLCGLGAAALLSGVAGLVLAPAHARPAALVPLLLAAPLALFIAREQERSTVGEMLAAASLSSAGLPVALAAEVAPRLAWEALGVWTLSFGASTWAVRTVIASHKAAILWPRRILPLLLPLGLSAVLWHVRLLSSWALAAALPQMLFALIAAASPPHPRSLRRVGFSLMTSCFFTAGLLVAGARW